MSIAVDARYLKRPGIGISVYLSEVIDSLVAGGLAVTLLTDGPQHAADLLVRYPGASTEVIDARGGFLWEQYALPRYLRQAGHGLLICGANFGLPLRPTRGTRTALIVHDVIPLRMPRTYLLNRPAWTVKYLLSTAISFLRADMIIVNSRATARDVRRLSRTRSIHVRYPLTPPMTTTTLPSGWPSRFLLYNGGLDERKNVGTLLEAFATLRRAGEDMFLVLIGHGYEVLAPRIEELGLQDAVLIPGYVDDGLKAGLIAAAAAVVYPSSWEGFGLPIVEALAAGTPVVVGTGGSQEEVAGAAGVYVDVRSARSISDGILRATAPSERLRVRVAGPKQLSRLRPASMEDPLLALVGECGGR